jgi:hypothetical protein
MYLILAKMTKHFGTNQLFPLLKYMINIYNMSFFISYPLSTLLHISSLEPSYRLSG